MLDFESKPVIRLFKRKHLIRKSLTFNVHNSKAPKGILLFIELGRDILDISIFSKFGEGWMKIVLLKERTSFWLNSSKAQMDSHLIQSLSFKGHNSKVPSAIWLNIEHV